MRERSSYMPRRVSMVEESKNINGLVEKANSAKMEDHEKEVSMPSTEPGLFETQNKLAGTEFDPTIAGEDTSFNQQVNSVYASQSNQSSNEQTSADNLTPPPPGTPSKETMERLRAAVSKSPNNQTLTSKPMVATKNPEIKDKPRFGIGSLINRMAGTGQAEPTQNDIPKAQKDNGQNNYNAKNEELDSNKEKIEVPAFLRRQAN
jgi:cell division protein FtsZ